jgi:anti-sigma B factor antagonist
MELNQIEGDGHILVQSVGEVDLNTSPALREAVLAAIKAYDSVGIDLNGVDYMDSSGVATLVEGLKACADKKKTFTLVNPSEPVLKVLKLARLDGLFRIREKM